ncbi:hypothetical protein MSAN_02084000 [Mycena sanguinolenta]|uniref:DUF6534 domain-containing protein n=1 Tax=Mycena sanguinolenta TaxID=230812 RepID=A0A8H6XI80_9AGAR|nr:hypothetical protein MSAN_02084000 [Mycena sanguinolenta]
MSAPDVPTTMGALLIGGLFASLLSGVVTVQTLLYFRIYRCDPVKFKVLVLSVWGLDTLHTAFIWAGLWDYLIAYYGDTFDTKINFIPWSISMTVVITAIVTFLVHCFFVHRIFLLSRGNWFMVSPVIILALLRLAAASVTTGKMFHYKAFDVFKQHARWIFTLGLAVSSAVDVLITSLLFYLFQSKKPDTGHLKHVMDKLMLYAFETGSLTCVATIVAMISWVTMSHNLIFLGLHFVIGKLYANSLLVTLNTRRNIRRGSTSSGERGPVLFLEAPRNGKLSAPTTVGQRSLIDDYAPGSKELQITVEVETTTNIQYDSVPSVRGKGKSRY